MWIEEKGGLYNLATAREIKATERGVEVFWGSGGKLKLDSQTYAEVRKLLTGKKK